MLFNAAARNPERKRPMSPPVLRAGWTRFLAGAALAGTLAAAPAPPQTSELESLLRRAHQGDVSAQIRLGQRYWRDEGVERSETEAAKWFRKAAEQGHAFAQLSLGELYAEGQGVESDEVEAVKWIRKAAEQGHAMAQALLALRYFDGQGVEKDAAEAEKWARKAAQQGKTFALDAIGLEDPEARSGNKGQKKMP